jgi:hypothetical protein
VRPNNAVRIFVVAMVLLPRISAQSAQNGEPQPPEAVQLPTPHVLRADRQHHDPSGAREAFERAYRVFKHPRCMNCHPSGHAPLQGEGSHEHAGLRLQRGPDGNGVHTMRCGNCHQASNQPGPHMPPGAPQPIGERASPDGSRWRLPKPETPMVFQGRTPKDLCRQLQDPRQNGGLTPERLIHHVASDPLVLWGWNPGEGRSTPPLTHDEFVTAVTEWLGKGGACPR